MRYVFTRRALLSTLLLPAVARASDKRVLAAVKEMEARESLTADLRPYEHWFDTPSHKGLSLRAASPNGLAVCWQKDILMPWPTELLVESLQRGMRSMTFEGGVPPRITVSSDAQILVVGDAIGNVSGRWRLIVLDLRSDPIARHDLRASLTAFPQSKLDIISISDSGELVALSSREQTQVVEIPSGKSVYTCPGESRLSPDGIRVASVHKDHLYIHSLADGSTTELLSGTRVKGIGKWSPNGRYLPAGAYTKLIALDKRQIIIDTTTGHYGVVDELQEGDFGQGYGWISTKLIARSEARS
jgi:hypothetical protein